MPAYSSTTLPPALYSGDIEIVWNAESPATSSASSPVALYAPPFGAPDSIAVSVSFSGDPGTFRIDVQDADVDSDASFGASGSVLGSITAATSQTDGTYTARFETQCQSHFVRLLMQDDPSNAVTTTARISR